jgi:hypothetical protein
MPKISIENVESILLEKKIEAAKVQEIVKELEQAVQEEKEEKQSHSAPKAKWEYVIVLNDPDNKINKEEVTGWVVQAKEGKDLNTVLSDLSDSAQIQNELAKRKKSLIRNFGELFQGLKTKFFKEKGLKIKTKDPVRILTVNGRTM